MPKKRKQGKLVKKESCSVAPGLSKKREPEEVSKKDKVLRSVKTCLRNGKPGKLVKKESYSVALGLPKKREPEEVSKKDKVLRSVKLA